MTDQVPTPEPTAEDLIDGDTDPSGAAVSFGIDEVIEPAETRRVLRDVIRQHRHSGIQYELRTPSPLSSWPTSW
ncbi:MAG: hypothetical protein ABW122_10810 [Ilumatobacteraceae bacterium]